MSRTIVLMFIVLLGLGYYANSWLNRADKISHITQRQSAPILFQEERVVYIDNSYSPPAQMPQFYEQPRIAQDWAPPIQSQERSWILEQEQQRQLNDLAFNQAMKMSEMQAKMEAKMEQQQKEAEFQARQIQNQVSWMEMNPSNR